LDAYLKALCYSELHDLGGTNLQDGPEENAYIRQVPQDFPFYPSTFSEEHPDLTAEVVSKWWRDEITAQRDQSMKGDDQSSASTSVQSMTHMTPPQAVNMSNSETPGKTPRTAPPKTPANNTKAANAAKVTPSSPTNPDVTTKTKSSLKPSSYGKSSYTNPDHPISKAQELLDLLNSTSDDGLEYNVDGEIVFANLILEPKDGVHPWILVSKGLQELLEVAR
jgi:hypothetical protein